MNLFEKLYSIIIFIAIIIGLLAGQVDKIQVNAETFIVPSLVVMLYITFLQIPLKEIKRAFSNIPFSSTSVLINFVWTPILAWLLASLFLADHPALYLGFIMLMVTPCTDWYLIFTGLAKGNVALSTAILPLNLVLQVAFLPIYLLIFGGATGVIDLTFLFESVLIVLIVPLTLALLTRKFLKRKQIMGTHLPDLGQLSILFLSLAIACMFASQGQLFLQNLELIWKLTFPTLLFFVINFVVGQFIGRSLSFSYEDRVSLSLTTLARNSPIALAIAMTAFPDQPLMALTLIIGPLLELPVLAILSQILLMIRRGKS